MKAVNKNQNHVLVLERGDNVIETITKYCEEKGITFGVFTGIGAVERVKIGYYDLGKREYFFRDEPGVFEVASMNGNVALVYPEETRWMEGPSTALGAGKPFIHAHAVLSRCDETLECIGAHIKEAFVAVTLEVFLTPLDISLGRELNELIGLKLLKL